MGGDLAKLLDNGWIVSLYANDLGSYTAMAFPAEDTNIPEMADQADEQGWLTDHHTPRQAITQLADKIYGVGMYSED